MSKEKRKVVAEAWINKMGWMNHIKPHSKIDTNFWTRYPAADITRVVKPKGGVWVTREMLVKAWDITGFSLTVGGYGEERFGTLAHALGLEDEK